MKCINIDMLLYISRMYYRLNRLTLQTGNNLRVVSTSKHVVRDPSPQQLFYGSPDLEPWTKYTELYN